MLLRATSRFLPRALTCVAMLLGGAAVVASTATADDLRPEVNAVQSIREGRQIFRFSTFGSEAFWGGQLQLHRAIAGAATGGVGGGLSPKAALSLGLKVDSQALPSSVRRALRSGDLDPDDPKVTLALLELDAVVGLTGFLDDRRRLKSVGIQCALCHSTVGSGSAQASGRISSSI